ncbi:MAG: macro domain-containing protein [Henriciella sp.]|uniref:macro domain-containing protein n=1 Tax=Henriciella sp. TaxID=1968823 RepID=UPI0026295A84|nr:macro domain-containing protein [Henriciella sp.]
MKGTLELYRGNLLDVDCDAVVNAANSSLMGGGGVDGAIHRAAGPELKEACRPLAPCPTGEVRVTEGFGLGDRLIFHTVGPVWRGGNEGEAELLASCYRKCLDALIERELTSIVFPAISTGAYGFPVNEAAGVAVHECRPYAKKHDIKITLSAFDQQNATAIEGALESA